MRAICRDCGELTGADACAPCPACGGGRRIAHPEALDLTIAHLDCDAFYAAIEKRDDPSLAAKPVIIGGGRRGVVATACYVARAYGVRSAMPTFKALRLCPAAVVLKPNMAKYVEEGRKVRALMQALTPAVEPLSIDEAFLDLSGLEALHKAAPVQTLARLQRRVLDEVGITVSIGLSFNKFLAKTASDLDKPNGFSVIGRAEALDFLAPRSVASLPGVGPAGAKTLAAMGIATIADLRAADVKALTARLGEWGYRLFEFAHARDPRKVDPDGARRSISAETTFGDDIRAREALEDRLWLLCEKVAARARASDAAGWTVSLKLKSSDFRTISRARRLNEPTLLASRLFDAGCALLAPEATGRTSFRLIGIGLSDLTPAAQADQGDLADQETPRRAAAEAAIAKARAKFGAGAVKTGRTLRIEDED
jgi:DNA polymerase-4